MLRLTACQLALGFLLFSPLIGGVQPQDTLSTSSLKHLSLEELMNIDITIVARRDQKWFEASAAVYVIPGDEIRRRGAKSIPEALRLAPNLNVAQVDARQWAISSRGFNSTSANKLLVLIDGRSVYTPLYSGVFWDVQDVLLEDVDRIEVVSGPGGALWGANAVNGVINIITKSSMETLRTPLYLKVGGGTNENLTGAVRYGGPLGSSGSYRTYARYFDRGSTNLESGGDANDSWSGLMGGFRTDLDLSSHDQLVIHGDLYKNRSDQRTNDDIRMEGGNIVGKWSHEIGDQSVFSAQTYFDYTHRQIPGTFGEDLGVFDLEFDHQFSLGETQDLAWGLGFRHYNDRVANSAALAFLPPNLQTRLYTGFVQDIIAITEDVTITVGSKFERNDFSDFEIQPRVSIGWTRSEREFVWASVSRAVRTPSRIDRDLFVPGDPPYLLAGGAGFTSEKLVAFEAGYRIQPSDDLLLDLALFHNSYDDLRSLEPGPPLVIANGLEGETYGGELVMTTQISGSWRVRTGYSHLQKSIDVKSSSMDTGGGLGEGNDHKHRLVVQSLMDVLEFWEVDLWFRFTDELPNPNASVPSYASLDCRLGWNPTASLRLSLLVQNVFPSRHSEFGSPLTRKELGRELFGNISFSL